MDEAKVFKGSEIEKEGWTDCLENVYRRWIESVIQREIRRKDSHSLYPKRLVEELKTGEHLCEFFEKLSGRNLPGQIHANLIPTNESLSASSSPSSSSALENLRLLEKGLR